MMQNQYYQAFQASQNHSSKAFSHQEKLGKGYVFYSQNTFLAEVH